MTRWRECSRTAAKALRRRLTEPGVMCYKSPGGWWRRPSSGRGHGQGLSVSRRAESILARRPTSRAICLQLKMTSRIFSTTAVGDFISAQSHPWVATGRSRTRLLCEAGSISRTATHNHGWHFDICGTSHFFSGIRRCGSVARSSSAISFSSAISAFSN